MGERLLRDPIVRVALVLFALLPIPYLLPSFDSSDIHWYAADVQSLVLIGLTLSALLFRLRNIPPGSERRYWELWSVAVGIWLAAEVWDVFLRTEDGLVVNASQDFLYFGFYAVIAWSLESKPHIARGAADEKHRLGALEPVGGSVFALGLVAYLVAIPAALDQESYLSLLPVYLLFVILDAYLSLRLEALRRSCRSRRWRAIYTWLLATTLLWMVVDGLDLLMSRSLVPTSVFWTPLDFLWWASFATLIVAVRLRESPLDEDERPAKVSARRGFSLYQSLGLDPSLALAVSFLVFHFAMSLLGGDPPVVRTARDVCALAVLLTLTGLALIRMRRLRARSRSAEESQRLAEREKDRLEANLRQAQRLEAVGVLTGGIAHDFNNMMTVIKGHAELALEHDLAPEGDSDLRVIAKTADRATELTRQLLAFGRQQVLRPRVTDLNAVVMGLEELLRSTIGGDLELVLDLDGRLGKVEVDPGQIERVLLNLTMNARDAMLGGGSLRIATTNRRLQGPLGHAGDEIDAGDYVTISVSDTGVGMEEEVRQRVFEPFFSTRERDKGTGLGLAVVYGIVRQSGGQIRIESVPGVGSTFTIYLPRLDEEAAPVEGPYQPSVSAVGTETILLVEDDEQVRLLLERTLEGQGYRVLTASNAEDALKLCIEHPRIDLLLTDIVLPGMSGADLAKLRSWPKMLFISGYADEKLRAKGVGDPGIPFLQKPFAPSELVRMVRRVLDTERAPVLSSLEPGDSPTVN